MMPATFARMSMPGPAAAMTRSTSSWLVTSAVTSSAVRPACSRMALVSVRAGSARSQPITWAPSRTSRKTVARPIPLPAPVTIATLPA